MTFGMEKGDVIEHVQCPRCGAPAVIRAKIREGSTNFEEYLTCEKCHLVKFAGIVTYEYMADQHKLNRLRKSREKAKTKRDLEKIDSKIKAIEERMMLSGLISTDRSSVRPLRRKEKNRGGDV